MPRTFSLWRLLTDPPRRVIDPERRRQLQLLSALLLVLAPLGLLAISIELRMFPGFRPTFLAVGGAMLVLLVAYGIARSGHYVASASLTIATVIFASFSLVVLNPKDAVAYAFLCLGMIVGRLLFNARGVWVATTASLIGAVVVLPWFGIAPPGDDPVVVPIFLIITAALLLVAIWYRDALERDRRQAIEGRERDFRTILENLQDTYYQVDADGRITRVSPSVVRLLGFSPDELLGRPLADLYVDPDGHDRFLNALQAGGGAIQEYEAVLRHRDGRDVWVATNSQYIRNAAGQIAGVEGTARDITERVLARNKLRESEEMLNKAQEVAKIGSWWWDLTTGRFIGSREFYRLYGIDQDPAGPVKEILDQISAAIHPDDRDRVMQSMSRSIETGRPPEPLEYRVQPARGTIRTVYSYPEIVCDQAGRPLYSYGAIQDITDRKRIEENLLDIARGLSTATGDTFFEQISKHVARVMRADFVFIGELMPGHHERIRTASYVIDGQVGENFEYELAGTPCQHVYAGVPSAFSRAIQDEFPEDALLADMGAQAYVGTPLFASNGRVLGLIAALYRRPIDQVQTYRSTLEIFATRAASELERLRAEQALLDSERRYRTIVETAQEGIWVIDADNRTTFVNARMAEILGYTSEEMLGRQIFFFMDERSRELAMARLERRRAGIAEQHSLQYRRKDGSAVVVSISATPLRDASGHYAGAMAMVSDITHRKAAEDALRQSEENYRLLFENMTSGFALHEIICDDHGNPVDYRYLQANPAFERLTGVPVADLPGKRIREILPNTEDYWIEVFGKVALTGEPVAYENYSRELGRYYDTWVFQPRPGQFAVIFTDITKRKIAEAEMQKLSSAIAQTADSVLITNREGIIEYVNPAFEHTTGYSREDALGQTPGIVKSGRQSQAFYANLWRTILRGDVFSGVMVNRKKDGSLYHEEKTITPLTNDAGEITHFISTGKDVTDRIQAQERMEYMAQHDALTTLPNRLLLLDRLKQALTRARWHQRLVALLFIDLDRFKNINDSLGHEAGDRLLELLAERFSLAIRDGDTVARFGGDEFVILLDDMANSNDAGMVAQKVLDALAEPFEVGGHSLYITASIGISLYPGDGDESGILLKHADVAMYRAKELGKNTYQFYSSDMSARAFERLSLETRLRRALELGEFELHYQPQIEVDSGRVVGVEALIRWRHPEFGLVQPNDFVPLLEETGLIVPTGAWVLEAAGAQLAEWHRRGWHDLRMAVNISARQFQGGGLRSAVEKALVHLAGRRGVLELEITESLLVQHATNTTETMEALQGLGVRFAIDDFGTGYSSFSYLRRLPIDTLKIDRTFVHDIPGDPDDSALTTAIAAMAGSLKLELVAEGVESDSQRQFLRALGCQVMQGHFFSRPLPADQATAFLAERDVRS